MVAGLVNSQALPHHHHQGELSGTIPASLLCAVLSQEQGGFSYFQALRAGLPARVSSTELPRQGAGSALVRVMTSELTPTPVMGGKRWVGHLSLAHATVWQMSNILPHTFSGMAHECHFPGFFLLNSFLSMYLCVSSSLCM